MDEAKRFWEDEFLPELTSWIRSVLPTGVALPDISEHGDVPHFGIASMAWTVLAHIQDEMVEDILWGTPWPAPDGIAHLPDPHAEASGDGVVVGYRLGNDWVLRSPEIPVPLAFIFGTRSAEPS